VPLASVNAQLEELSTRRRKQFAIKTTADSHLYAEPMHAYRVEGVRPAIITLLGAVGVVLLIACANIANLLLVRTASRERERAVRAALGGSRSRIAIPLFAEVALVAMGGALLALLLAQGGIRLLVSMAPENLSRLDGVGIDPMVLGFAMLATVLAALLFGMMPVLRGTRFDLATVL
jgi:ABC-type antimicrobial peptide transport system permease subunit